MPKPNKAIRRIPKFESEAQEREFWAKHDSTAYVNWRQAKRLRLSSLRPATRTVSIRLPVTMIESLKILANERDVPYKALLKMFLADRIKEERRAKS